MNNCRTFRVSIFLCATFYFECVACVFDATHNKDWLIRDNTRKNIVIVSICIRYVLHIKTLILTLQLRREKRRHAILLANLADKEFELVHVCHAARLFRMNAFSEAPVYLDVVLSTNLPCWTALAAEYSFWLNVHL